MKNYWNYAKYLPFLAFAIIAYDAILEKNWFALSLVFLCGLFAWEAINWWDLSDRWQDLTFRYKRLYEEAEAANTEIMNKIVNTQIEMKKENEKEFK